MSRVKERKPRRAPVRPCGRDRPERVLVLCANIGEGHAAAARATAEQVRRRRPGAEVVIEDGIAAMGSLPRWALETNSRVQFRWLPGMFTLTYLLLMHCGPARRLGMFLLNAVGGGLLLERIRGHRPDVVVSTYPVVTALLGRMRERGELEVPVVATITDLTGLFFWAHPGVDLHLAAYEESLHMVERIAGPGRAHWIQPLIASEFLSPRSRAQARRTLSLADSDKVVLVSGGGWGVGDLEGAVRTAREVQDATVLCVCGRNEAVRERLTDAFLGDERVRVLGFALNMSDLLAAANVVVHSTGGVTCLEARARDCPVVVYGFPVGHARANARAMDRLGLVRQAGSRRALTRALEEALGRSPSPAPLADALPDAGALVVAARPAPRPAPQPRSLVRQPLAWAAASVLLTGWLLLSDDPYPVIARAFEAEPLTTLSTSRPQVGLVIEAPASDMPAVAADLRRRHARASFAATESLPACTMAALKGSGDGVLAVPGPRGTTAWLHTSRWLRRRSSTLVPPRALYLVPDKGFSFGQYVLARGYGRPVRGAVRVGSDRSDRASISPRPGEIVVVELSRWPGPSRRSLSEVLGRLDEAGLSAVPLDALVAPSATRTPTAREPATATAPPSVTTRETRNTTVPGPLSCQLSPATSGASSTGTRT